ACLQGTPAHDQVRAALAQIASARVWVKEKLPVIQPAMKSASPACATTAERRQIVHRRMSRLSP
ncbi:MAG: hypothetical protein PSV22_06680, partial [Pseudolabrys sp.]|nr:hypothetical protein [Pseudolabrys sp.]